MAPADLPPQLARGRILQVSRRIFAFEPFSYKCVLSWLARIFFHTISLGIEMRFQIIWNFNMKPNEDSTYNTLKTLNGTYRNFFHLFIGPVGRLDIT